MVKKKRNQKLGPVILIQVSAQLKARVLRACHAAGITIRQLVTEAVEAYLKRKERGE